MHSLFTKDDLASAPIEEGDAGIILKADGTFRMFSTGVVDGELSPAQARQAETMVALAVALKLPQMMDVLITMSKDPAIIGNGVDSGPLN